MKLFVSYSSKNRPAVKALVADLASLGHDVWFDQQLSGGQVWWDTILENVRACELFVLAMSSHSLKSGPCKLEYTYAYELGKPILPVLMSDDVTISLLPVVLQERQYVNYINQDKAALLALNSAIQAIPPVPALPEPLPTPPAIPISPLAELQVEIDKRELSYEQQVAAFLRIKDYVDDPDQREAALELLKQLEQHPSLLAAVFKEINTYLSAVAPGRTPKPEVDAAPNPGPPDAQTNDAPPAGPPPESGLAQLRIRRPQSMFAVLRGLGVHMDGNKIGEVRNNQTVLFEVPAGAHDLHVQVDWIKSDPLHVTLKPGDTAKLVATTGFGLSWSGAKLELTWDDEA